MQALGRPGDLLIGISISGNSENVLRAVEYAWSHRLSLLRSRELAPANWRMQQIAIRVPSTTQFIQESHIMIAHIRCDLVEQALTYDDDRMT